MAKFHRCDMCGREVSNEDNFYDVQVSHKGNKVRRVHRGYRYLETCPVCVKEISELIEVLKIRDGAETP